MNGIMAPDANIRRHWRCCGNPLNISPEEKPRINPMKFQVG